MVLLGRLGKELVPCAGGGRLLGGGCLRLCWLAGLLPLQLQLAAVWVDGGNQLVEEAVLDGGDHLWSTQDLDGLQCVLRMQRGGN